MKKNKITFSGLWQKLTKISKIFLMTLGSLSLLMVVLSFTSYPYDVYHWLGTHNAKLECSPDYIVVMGAGGMPGPGGLMRSHFAAEAALIYPKSKIIIALPVDTSNFTGSDAYRMFESIATSNIDTSRFIFETNGTNTYTQACEIRSLLQGDESSCLLIVSSPEHIRRCMLTFRKCGFVHVGGLPAFEAAFSDDLLLTEKERREKIKAISRSVGVRYNMWNYLQLQIALIREFTALGYYKLKGYI